MLIESPKVTLANYKLMLKKSREQTKLAQGSGIQNLVSHNLTPSMMESVASTDTCIFSGPINSDSNEIEELKTQMQEMQKFTSQALAAQKSYFEGIISELEIEIKDEKEFFYREIRLIREELLSLKEEKSDISTALPDSLNSGDYKTQYFKNQEFIEVLERQNKLLYQKIMKNK